jgi:hypothetical protein
VNLPILELAAASEERREAWGVPVRLERRIPWPCSIDGLKRHIEVALSKSSEATRTTRMAGKEAG